MGVLPRLFMYLFDAESSEGAAVIGDRRQKSHKTDARSKVVFPVCVCGIAPTFSSSVSFKELSNYTCQMLFKKKKKE